MSKVTTKTIYGFCFQNCNFHISAAEAEDVADSLNELEGETIDQHGDAGISNEFGVDVTEEQIQLILEAGVELPMTNEHASVVDADLSVESADLHPSQAAHIHVGPAGDDNHVAPTGDDHHVGPAGDFQVGPAENLHVGPTGDFHAGPTGSVAGSQESVVAHSSPEELVSLASSEAS